MAYLVTVTSAPSAFFLRHLATRCALLGRKTTASEDIVTTWIVPGNLKADLSGGEPGAWDEPLIRHAASFQRDVDVEIGDRVVDLSQRRAAELRASEWQPGQARMTFVRNPQGELEPLVDTTGNPVINWESWQSARSLGFRLDTQGNLHPVEFDEADPLLLRHAEATSGYAYLKAIGHPLGDHADIINLFQPWRVTSVPRVPAFPGERETRHDGVRLAAWALEPESHAVVEAVLGRGADRNRLISLIGSPDEEVVLRVTRALSLIAQSEDLKSGMPLAHYEQMELQTLRKWLKDQQPKVMTVPAFAPPLELVGSASGRHPDIPTDLPAARRGQLSMAFALFNGEIAPLCMPDGTLAVGTALQRTIGQMDSPQVLSEAGRPHPIDRNVLTTTFLTPVSAGAAFLHREGYEIEHDRHLARWLENATDGTGRWLGPAPDSSSETETGCARIAMWALSRYEPGNISSWFDVDADVLTHVLCQGSTADVDHALQMIAGLASDDYFRAGFAPHPDVQESLKLSSRQLAKAAERTGLPLLSQ